jgi:hypothetical protein
MRSAATARLALVFYVTERSHTSQAGAAVAGLSHLGAVLASSSQKVSTYDKRLKVEELFPVTPTPIEGDELRDLLTVGGLHRQLATRNQDVLTISEDLATQVIDCLRRLRPAMAPAIDWLRALDGFGGLGFSETEVLWREQRDAVNVGLRIGGFSPTPLRAWRRPADHEPFLAGVVPYPRPSPSEPDSPPEAPSAAQPHEPPEREGSSTLDHPHLSELVPAATEPRLVDHDARVFPGWEPEPNQQVHIHTFTDGHRRMEVANVDASGVEARTGADLIYYHVNTRSFVLVQYKRMQRGSLVVDNRLRGQLARMEALTSINQKPSQPDDWRIGPDFGFLKLADADGRDTPADRLVRGLYLPSSYTRILLGQGRTRLGYGTGDRYLTNQQFIDLVAHGLVGTVGITATDLRRVVNGLIDAGGSVVIAKDYSEEATDERQRRLRSRKAR